MANSCIFRKNAETLFMTSKKSNIRSFIPAILSLILSIGSMTVFQACDRKEDGTWMHCHEAQIAAAVGGLILMILLLGMVFIRNKTFRIGLGVISILGAAVVFLIPGTIISMCMMHTMRCYVLMQPFVRIVCALIMVSAAARAIRSFKD